jgi:sialic acid synthase SpsE
MHFSIGSRRIGPNEPTYFIAEIGSNFDQDLGRAKHLIHLAKDSGADAAKFQHFTASTLVNDSAFKSLGKFSHQSSWSDSVYDVYDNASLNIAWTARLKSECDAVGIDFITSPYSLDLLSACVPYISCIKIGSGDITHIPLLKECISFDLPMLIGTGASSILDVQRVVRTLSASVPLCLMQCNTNYTANPNDYQYQHIRALNLYRRLFPDVFLGISCHSKSPLPVLAAVSLGASVVEKHFTDDCSRPGPDHSFALSANEFRSMVDQVRDLEVILGLEDKSVQLNEQQTYFAQRRSICIKHYLPSGHIITEADLDYLRPYLPNSFHPYQVDHIIGRVLAIDLPPQTVLLPEHLN